jgi:hypothetical protein
VLGDNSEVSADSYSDAKYDDEQPLQDQKDDEALATAPNKTDDVEMKDATATKPAEDDSEKAACTKEAGTKQGGTA